MYVFVFFVPMVQTLSAAVLLQSTCNGTPFLDQRFAANATIFELAIKTQITNDDRSFLNY